MQYLAYLGTDSVRGSRGIYTVSLDSETGGLRLLGATAAQDAGYLALSEDGTMLYAAIESMILDGKPQGGVAAYQIGADGLPVFKGRQGAAGQLICHVSCGGDRVYASSYLNGTVSIFQTAGDGGLLPCDTVIRHTGTDGYAPHIHCAKLTADGRYLCVVEVGYHALCLYDTAHYEKQYEIRTKPVRPRQVVCTESCVYLLTEGGMTVDVYAYRPDSAEKLTLKQSLSCLPEGFRGMGGAGGIRLSPDGNTLFASIRGADVMAVFAVDDRGMLEKRSVTKLCGSTPRDFNVSPDGRHLLIGLQKSDTMAVYGFDPHSRNLTLETADFHIPSCSCVEFRRCQ